MIALPRLSMQRTWAAALAGLGIVGGSIADVLQTEGTPASKPNFIIFMTDDHYWSHVGYNNLNGFPGKTPVLTEIANTGIRFDRFYAGAPYCSPSRGATMTGRATARFSLYEPGQSMTDSELTIAELLKEQGYATGHFGKWHLSSMVISDAEFKYHPGSQGFDYWLMEGYAGNGTKIDQDCWTRNGELAGPNGYVPGRNGIIRGYVDDIIAEEAIGWIKDQARAGRPFFATIWFAGMHDPWASPKKYKARYSGSDKDKNYLGMITGVDTNVGKVRKALKDEGVFANTMSVFLGDQGGNFKKWESLRADKGELWEGGLRVPAVLEYPALVEKPMRTNHPYIVYDLLPTLMELSGMNPDSIGRPIDGISMVPLLRGADSPRSRKIGIEFNHPGKQGFGKAGFVVMDDQYKLVTDLDGRRKELYDVVNDKRESKNIASSNPAKLKELDGFRKAFWTSVQKSKAGHDYGLTRLRGLDLRLAEPR